MKFTFSAYTHKTQIDISRGGEAEDRIKALLALGYFVVDCKFWYI